jgi:thioredoxin 1
MKLTSEQLQEKIQSNEKFIVDYYAEWCGPCKTLSIHLEKVEAKLKETDSHVKIYKFDISDDKELMVSMGIRTIPTLQFYSNGKLIDKCTSVLPENEILKRANNL